VARYFRRLSDCQNAGRHGIEEATHVRGRWCDCRDGSLRDARRCSGRIFTVNAITLGALSAPGTPFRVFTEGPGTTAMNTLPWIMVPTMLVPLYLLIHFTIAAKLRLVERAPQALPMASSAA
jgi:hypothetical protein